jgi:hypothetical protein
MTGTTSYGASVVSPLNNAILSVTGQGISASVTGTLFVFPFGPVPGAAGERVGLVRVEFDSAVLGVSFSPTSPLSQATSPGEITITGFNSFTSPNFLSFTPFSLTNPASTAPTLLTITTISRKGTTLYNINSKTITLQATASSITQAGLIQASALTLQTQNLNVWFVNVNGLVASSRVVVTVPGEVGLTGSTCESSHGTCTISTADRTATLLLSSPTAPSTNISLLLKSITNPAS